MRPAIKAMLPILSVIMIVAVSGCVQKDVKVDQNNGLTINEFTADWNRVDEGEWVNLYLEVENVGGTTAEDVSVLLYGAPGWGGVGDSYKKLDDLDPPDLSMKTAGKWTSFSTDIQAPNLLEGIEQDYEITARVKYDYTTTATAKITAINENEAKRRLQHSETLDTPPVTTNSNAPIKIRVEGPSPVVMKDNNELVNYRLIFENLGAGVPIDDTQKIGPVFVRLETDNPQVQFEDCLGSSGHSVSGVVELRRGDTSTRSCTLVVPKNMVSQKPEETIMLKFTADYAYYIESSVVITVVGKK